MSYNKRFSIDDAFEDEPMDDVNVFESNLGNSPLQSPGQTKLTNYGGIEHESVTRTKKFEDTLSRDSDSLIYNSTTYSNKKYWCWHHPQIRENWRIVLAAVILLIIGTILLLVAIIVEFTPDTNYHPIVFFIAGFICFIPGAYHVVYIYLAAKGHPEYKKNLIWLQANKLAMPLCLGDSMEPSIQSGDLVFIQRFSKLYNSINNGDLVIAKSPSDDKLFILKRVKALDGQSVRRGVHYQRVPRGSVWLEGDNFKVSEDSWTFGPVPKGLIYGRVVCRIWPLSNFSLKF